MKRDFEMIEITEILVSAKAGAHIGGCLRDCMELAVNEWRNVRLIHNDKVFLIMPNNLLAACEEVKK